MRFAAVASGVSPVKGSCPVTISYITTPSAKRSVLGVMAPPVTCSGAMYSGVPIIPAPPVRPASPLLSSGRAMPKSVMTARVEPESPVLPRRWTRRTLLLLKSRWTTPSA